MLLNLLNQLTIISVFAFEVLLEIRHKGPTHSRWKHSRQSCSVDPVKDTLKLTMWNHAGASDVGSTKLHSALKQGGFANKFAWFYLGSMATLIYHLSFYS